MARREAGDAGKRLYAEAGAGIGMDMIVHIVRAAARIFRKAVISCRCCAGLFS